MSFVEHNDHDVFLGVCVFSDFDIEHDHPAHEHSLDFLGHLNAQFAYRSHFVPVKETPAKRSHDFHCVLFGSTRFCVNLNRGQTFELLFFLGLAIITVEQLSGSLSLGNHVLEFFLFAPSISPMCTYRDRL